jgi:hypothetical protein
MHALLSPQVTADEGVIRIDLATLAKSHVAPYPPDGRHRYAAWDASARQAYFERTTPNASALGSVYRVPIPAPAAAPSSPPPTAVLETGLPIPLRLLVDTGRRVMYVASGNASGVLEVDLASYTVARRLELPAQWRAQALLLDATRGRLLVSCSHATPDGGGAIVTVDLAAFRPVGGSVPLQCGAGEFDSSPAREGQSSYVLPPASRHAYVPVRGCKDASGRVLSPALLQLAL